MLFNQRQKTHKLSPLGHISDIGEQITEKMHQEWQKLLKFYFYCLKTN